MAPRRTKGPELTSLIDFIERAAAAGVDLIQIRERDLSALELSGLTAACQSAARKHGAAVLVNDRADIAASHEAGVHLTTRSLAPDVVREAFGSEMLIGVSTHAIEEVEAAEEGGADFVVFGPVFETASKKEYGDPVGLEALRRAAGRSKLPVLALGGLKLPNYRLALDAGAAGVAGISMFTEAKDLRALVATIKGA